MNIYIPFTYLIGWSQHNKFYYGRKTAKNCHPSDLWKSYFTSSKQVKEFRLKFGDPDIIQIRKIFPNNPKACSIWENKVLKRMDVQHDLRFLNKRNGDYKWDTTGISPSKDTIDKLRKGIKLFWQNISIEKRKEIQDKKIKTCLNRYGFEYGTQVPYIKEKTKQTCLEKYGCEYSLQNLEVREKGKQTSLEKYGFEYPNQSPERKEKYKQACLEKYGYDTTFKIPEIIDANLKKVKEKYGVLDDENITNVYQIEEIKEKIKEIMISKYGVVHPSKRIKQCSHCGEIKNIQHEAVCQMNANRKMPNVSGENNGRANTFIIKSPENEEYEIKLHDGVREFCKQRALKIHPFMKNKIPGWSIHIKEKV